MALRGRRKNSLVFDGLGGPSYGVESISKHVLRWAHRMRQFKWIEWNIDKIDAHALSSDEVEAAFDRVLSLQQRNDGSFQMFAETPAGRRIWVIWRYDREDDAIPALFGELNETPIFVITAY